MFLIDRYFHGFFVGFKLVQNLVHEHFQPVAATRHRPDGCQSSGHVRMVDDSRLVFSFVQQLVMLVLDQAELHGGSERYKLPIFCSG